MTLLTNSFTETYPHDLSPDECYMYFDQIKSNRHVGSGCMDDIREDDEPISTETSMRCRAYSLPPLERAPHISDLSGGDKDTRAHYSTHINAQSPNSMRRPRRVSLVNPFEQIVEDDETQGQATCTENDSGNGRSAPQRSQSVTESLFSPHSRPGEMLLQRALSHSSPKRTPPPPLNIIAHNNVLNHQRPRLQHHRSCESLNGGKGLLTLPMIPEATSPHTPCPVPGAPQDTDMHIERDMTLLSVEDIERDMTLLSVEDYTPWTPRSLPS